MKSVDCDKLSDCKDLLETFPEMRIVIILFIVAIIASMGSALYYMVSDRSGGNRMLRALALRVGLSITLFLMLMASFYFGFIPGRNP